MSSTHVVIWLDHVEAHIIHFTADTAAGEVLKAHSMHPHLHVKAGNMTGGKAAETTRYFEDIISAVQNSKEILLMGPGLEKDVLMKYIVTHHKALAEKIVAALTSDHPTDPQILAFARKYFAGFDRMNSDPLEGIKHH